MLGKVKNVYGLFTFLLITSCYYLLFGYKIWSKTENINYNFTTSIINLKKLDINNVLKKFDIKNRTCDYFDDIIKLEDFNNISIDIIIIN